VASRGVRGAGSQQIRRNNSQQRAQLEDIPSLAAKNGNRAAVLLRNGGCARGGFARGRFFERGLAAAIWPKDADVLARGDLQVHFAERGVVSAHHGYVFEREKGWGHNFSFICDGLRYPKMLQGHLNRGNGKSKCANGSEMQ